MSFDDTLVLGQILDNTRTAQPTEPSPADKASQTGAAPVTSSGEAEVTFLSERPASNANKGGRQAKPPPAQTVSDDLLRVLDPRLLAAQGNEDVAPKPEAVAS